MWVRSAESAINDLNSHFEALSCWDHLYQITDLAFMILSLYLVLTSLSIFPEGAEFKFVDCKSHTVHISDLLNLNIFHFCKMCQLISWVLKVVLVI